MKHYDEWYAVYIKKAGYNKSGATYTKAAYRAALEWVKNQSQSGKNLYMIDCRTLDKELNEN